MIPRLVLRAQERTPVKMLLGSSQASKSKLAVAIYTKNKT